MTISSAALDTFEQLLNRAIRLDPQGLARLAPMHGRVIKFDLIGVGRCFYLIPDPCGVQIYQHCEGDADCVLRGTPLDLARMRSSRASADQLFSGSVEIIGDSALAQQFAEALFGLDIDWEEQLSRLTGDVLAHEIGHLGRGLFRWGERVRKTAGLNLKEYLQEELRMLPTREEIEPLLADIDHLRDDVERLSARIERLQRHLDSSEPTQ
ncbi:MAG: SCP2 sterol-binding domain-containing protein [Chromatiales bacterium]|jgi:ubiquinone biosynthesis protein UbiJ